MTDCGGGNYMEMYYVSKGVTNFVEVALGGVNETLKNGHYYKIKMLEENELTGVFSTLSTEVDGQIYLKSNVTSYYILERMFSKFAPDGEFLRIIFIQILQYIRELENYLLVPEDLVICPEYMFYEPKEKQLKLIYIPGYGVDVKKQLKVFVEYIMKVFDHRDRKGTLLLYDIYNVLVREDTDVDDIDRLISVNFDEDKQIHYDNINTENCNMDMEEKTEIINNFMEHKIAVGVFFVIALSGLFFLARYFLCGGELIDICIGIGLLVGAVIIAALFSFKEEENVDEIMKEYKQNYDYNVTAEDFIEQTKEECKDETIKKLIPLTNGSLSEIYFGEDVKTIVVGRGKRDTDYRLPTTQISRIHACLYSIGGEVFVEDRDSTNGTYINNNRIGTLTQYKIKKGDVISFADEEFFAS